MKYGGGGGGGCDGGTLLKFETVELTYRIASHRIASYRIYSSSNREFNSVFNVVEKKKK